MRKIGSGLWKNIHHVHDDDNRYDHTSQLLRISWKNGVSCNLSTSRRYSLKSLSHQTPRKIEKISVSDIIKIRSGNYWTAVSAFPILGHKVQTYIVCYIYVLDQVINGGLINNTRALWKIASQRIIIYSSLFKIMSEHTEYCYVFVDQFDDSGTFGRPLETETSI